MSTSILYHEPPIEIPGHSILLLYASFFEIISDEEPPTLVAGAEEYEAVTIPFKTVPMDYGNYVFKDNVDKNVTYQVRSQCVVSDPPVCGAGNFTVELTAEDSARNKKVVEAKIRVSGKSDI